MSDHGRGRFPSRLLLTGAVLAAVAVTGTAALTFPEAAGPAVQLPETAGMTAPGGGSAGPSAAGADVADTDRAARDRAAQRERAAEVIAERAPAPPPPPSPTETEDQDSLPGLSDEMLDRLREACDDGRLRGHICERV